MLRDTNFIIVYCRTILNQLSNLFRAQNQLNQVSSKIQLIHRINPNYGKQPFRTIGRRYY